MWETHEGVGAMWETHEGVGAIAACILATVAGLSLPPPPTASHAALV